MADNYFDNKYVETLILEYQKINYFLDEEGVKQICLDEQLTETEIIRREILKNDIMTQVNEIIVRIISTYDFSRFEERDDLFQHAGEACFKSMKNFNPFHPKYSSAFNWFSLTAKRSLLNYTLRKQKHRGHHSIYDFFHIEFEEKALNTHIIQYELQNELIHIIDRNFLSQQRINYLKISIILVNYLTKTRKFKKTDFYAWSRSHGFTNSMCRQFIKDIGKHYNKITVDLLED